MPIFEVCLAVRMSIIFTIVNGVKKRFLMVASSVLDAFLQLNKTYLRMSKTLVSTISSTVHINQFVS